MNDHLEKVVLLNNHGDQFGSASKIDAHKQGLKHRAFSVFAFNHCGELLLQKRALGKYHSGGLWANTCCGHPRPGEINLKAATRRVKEELNISLKLTPFAETSYEASVSGGLIENEQVKCYAATLALAPGYPNPLEVSKTSFVGLKDLKKCLAKNPRDYAPWLKIYLEQIWDDLLEVSEICSEVKSDREHVVGL